MAQWLNGVARIFFLHLSILTLYHMILPSAAELNLKKAFGREGNERQRQYQIELDTELLVC